MQKAKFRLSGWLALFLCLTLFTLVLSACASGAQSNGTSQPAQATPTPAQNATSTSNQMTEFKGNGFTLSYSAADWEVKNVAGIKVLASTKNTAIALTLNSSPAQGKADLDKAMMITQLGMKATGNNFKDDTSAPTTTKIGGQDWKQKVASMDTKDASGKKVSVKAYVLAVQQGAHAYIMDYTLPVATADADQKDLIQPMLDSFKFV